MLRRSLSLRTSLSGGASILARRVVAAGGLSAGVAASSYVASCEVSSNPLLDAPALFPRFADIQAAHVQPAMTSRLAEAVTRLDALEKEVEEKLARGETPSYLFLADSVERLGELVSGPWGAVGHLKMVKDSEALRTAADAVEPEVVAFSSKLSGSAALYKGWCALRADAAAWGALSPAQRRVAELSTGFSNAVLDATKAYAKVLSSVAIQTEGLACSELCGC
jgi:Zn-dependent oligopeptidase